MDQAGKGIGGLFPMHQRLNCPDGANCNLFALHTNSLRTGSAHSDIGVTKHTGFEFKLFKPVLYGVTNTDNSSKAVQ